MAGISVRALHHYDQIGLLARRAVPRPLSPLQRGRSAAPAADPVLSRVGRAAAGDRPHLDDDDFDPLATLVAHGERLRRERERLGRLLETIERTMARIKGDDMT
jgi:hypothetical protein